MKKRSLFMATSMLLVAILALSSATYAWFSRSGTATIDTISMNVDKAQGLALSMMVNTTKVANLNKTMLSTPTETQNKFATGLYDVSTYLSSTDAVKDSIGTFYKPTVWGAGENGIVTVEEAEGATEGTHYSTFQFKIYNLNDTARKIQVAGGITSLTDSTAADIARIALQADTANDDALVFANAVAETQTISGLTGAVPTFTAFSPKAISSSATDFIASIPANSSVTVTAYVWVEGTDTQCTDNDVALAAAADDFDINLTFTSAAV